MKYFGLAKLRYISLTKRLKLIHLFSLFVFLGLCFSTFLLSLETVVVFVICGIITFLYAVPFIPRTIMLDKTNNLREIGGLKIYVIALIWTVVVVVIPIIDSGVIIGLKLWITFMQRFLFILALMIPFEIRDMNYDSIRLATLPQKIGIYKTKVLGLLFLLGFVILEYFKPIFNQQYFIVYFTIALLTIYLILNAKQKQSPYYSSFWVESLPIVWLFLYLV